MSLPSSAPVLLEIGRKTFNKKLRQRMILAKDMEQLKTFIEPKLLPKEQGGSFTEKRTMENFKMLFKANKKNINTINDYRIDWDEEEPKEACTLMQHLKYFF